MYTLHSVHLGCRAEGQLGWFHCVRCTNWLGRNASASVAQDLLLQYSWGKTRHPTAAHLLPSPTPSKTRGSSETVPHKGLTAWLAQNLSVVLVIADPMLVHLHCSFAQKIFRFCAWVTLLFFFLLTYAIVPSHKPTTCIAISKLLLQAKTSNTAATRQAKFY